MDPEATLHYWRKAKCYGDAELVESNAQALRDWLRMGGFEPSWQPGEREVFFPPKERLR